MKKLLILLMFTVSLFAATATSTEKVHKSDRLCKFFTQKVVDYKKHMRQDAYAYQTLKSYEKRAKMFCK